MTDPELQVALAKLLPEKIQIKKVYDVYCFYWDKSQDYQPIRNTEWLHVCWLIEQGMTDEEHSRWRKELRRPIERSQPVDALYGAFKRHYYSASWQQRAAAILKVKGTV